MIKQIGTYKFIDNDNTGVDKTVEHDDVNDYITNNVYKSGFNYDELKKYVGSSNETTVGTTVGSSNQQDQQQNLTGGFKNQNADWDINTMTKRIITLVYRKTNDYTFYGCVDYPVLYLLIRYGVIINLKRAFEDIVTDDSLPRVYKQIYTAMWIDYLYRIETDNWQGFIETDLYDIGKFINLESLETNSTVGDIIDAHHKAANITKEQILNSELNKNKDNGKE